jgi:hypothetical protein
MLKAIRSRLNAMSLVAVLALVFAMTGGAYAANKYLITSTKQIKPSVLKQLQGKAGVSGAQGPAGPGGATGPGGAQGPAGPQGPAGLPGKNGENGKPGKEGSPWTAGGTLPSGKTETGAWAANPAEGAEQVIPMSFGLPLAAELESGKVHIAPNAECPGTAKEPKANPGNLCVYTGEDLGGHVELTSILKPYAIESGAGTAGAILATKGAGTPPVAWGTWALTAE